MARAVYIGRYKVIEEIGRGGMGIVYRGEDPVLDRPVAIKVLPPKKTAQKKAVQRFLREARVSARLDHPHIVKVYDIGEEDGIYHIVMEYVQGDSLREIVERNLAEELSPDIREMARLFGQLTDALSYAHNLKITHRDIKPENVKITEDSKVKLMDFGIAVLDDSHSITEAGSVMGTIAYFSPEQARGLEADYRADIYSMGVVFYEMLTLQLPFEATSIPEMIHKHLHAAPVPPSKYNPDIPPVLENLILRCLEKEPDRRFQSASEAEKIISDFLDGFYDEPKSKPKEDEHSSLENLKKELQDSLSASFREPIYNEAYTPLSYPVSDNQKYNKVEKVDTADESHNMPIIPPLANTLPNVPVVSSPQALASDGWLAETSPSFEKRRYNEFVDRMKRNAENVKNTYVEETSSVVCPHCGQENYALGLVCTRCGEELSAAQYSGSKGAYSYNTQGLEYLINGDFENAISSFEESIKFDPEFYEARINLVKAIMESGDNKKALEYSSDVIEKFPSNAETHVIRAEIFRRMDTPDLAIEEYIKALKIEPNHLSARYQLAFLYTNRGSLSKAINEYRYVLALEPENIDAHRQLGYIYAGLEQIDDAIRELECVVSLDPNNAHIYTWLGDLYKKKRRFAQAEKNYNTSITLNPDDIANHNALGDLYMQQNRDDLAYRSLKSAIAIEDNKEARLSLADMYIKHSDPKHAIIQLEKVVKMYPGESQVHQKLGDLYMSMDCYNEALDHYEKSVSDAPTASAHNKLGMLYLKKDYTQLGILEYRKAVEMQPGNSEFREDLGMAYYCQGQKDRAIDELKKAVTLDSRNVDYYKAIGVMLEEVRRYDEAIKMLQKAQALSPRDSLIPALIGKVYFSQGLVSMALVEYQKALALQPTNYLYYIYIAKAYSKKRQVDEAIEYFKKAISFMPDRARGEYDTVMGRAYIDLGKAHIEKGEYEKAREVLLSAGKLLKNDSSVWALLGTACLNERRVDEAYKYLTEAIQQEPDNPNIIIDLSRCFLLKKDYEHALKMCIAAIKLQPNKREFKELAVTIYLEADRITEARAFVDNLMKSAQLDKSYCHYLKAKIAMFKKDFLLAEKEFTIVLEGSPSDWFYAKEFAGFLKSRSRYKEALEYIYTAIESHPGGKDYDSLLEESENLKALI